MCAILTLSVAARQFSSRLHAMPASESHRFLDRTFRQAIRFWYRRSNYVEVHSGSVDSRSGSSRMQHRRGRGSLRKAESWVPAGACRSTIIYRMGTEKKIWKGLSAGPEYDTANKWPAARAGEISE